MKYVLLTLSIWLIPYSVRAEPELGVMLKGGLNKTTLAEDYRVNRYGFSGGAGGYVQRSVSERFLLAGQVELAYTPRGAKANMDGTYLGQARYHYLDLMIEARPGARFHWANIYLLLGGGLNLLVSANNENAAGVKVDITNDLHRVDLALLIGGGVGLHLPGRGLGPFHHGVAFVEGRHDHGLLDTDAVNGGFKNRTSSIMLGISFSLTSGTSTTQLSSTSIRSDLTEARQQGR